MIKLTAEQIIGKIKEKADVSEEEVEKRIKEKLEQLAGLVSRDGAAHIVANELGVNAFEEFSSGKVKLDKLMPGMRSVDVVAKVVDVYEIREFSNDRGSGKVGSFLVGDETGLCRITCWHAQTDKMEGLKKDDVVKITNAYARENQSRIELHLNDKSGIEVNPPDEKVDVAAGMVQAQAESQRKKIVDLAENDNNVEILGTIVQVFEPRFFEVCPQCGKRARQREDQYACEAHGVVTPDYSYVNNVIVDDGSETIRAIFFREQMEALLGKKKEEVMQYREFKEKFDEVKIELLGQMIKLGGRVAKNSMFDRIEFNVRKVQMNPDPKEEIEKMNKELGDETTTQM
ncbi:OB-fold nucleic acid binding domain-containing protein [Nanoarchaeota archaeon]